MADASEDDITIIDGECTEHMLLSDSQIYNFNLSVLPNSAPANRNTGTDIHDASHHALSFAYGDLKKRFNELESKSQVLAKNLKRAQLQLQTSREMENMNGRVGHYDERLCPRSPFSDALVARDTQTDSVGDVETHLLSDAEQINGLKERLRLEKASKAALLRTIEELKLKCEQDVAKKEVELRRIADKLSDIENELKDTRDENACLKRKLIESQEALKTVTHAKLQAEKQLIQNDEYHELILSQMERMRTSTDQSIDQFSKQSRRLPSPIDSSFENDPVDDEDMRKAVDISHKLLSEISSIQKRVLDQKKQIQSVADGVKQKKASMGRLGRQGEYVRPKVPVQMPDREEPQVMQCEEDLRTMQRHSPNQTMLVEAVPSPRRKLSRDSANMKNPFDFTCSSPENSSEDSDLLNSATMQSILRKKSSPRRVPEYSQPSSDQPLEPFGVTSSRREPKRSHSAVLSGDSIFDNNEDIYNESMPPLAMGKGGRSATAPPLFRHSTGQVLFGNEPSMDVGPSDSMPSPEEWTNQALQFNNRPEPLGRCDNGENRSRPHAVSSQPRPLNIDRNVDEDTVPNQTSTSRTNVNLYTGHHLEKGGPALPQRPDLLNNDPLATNSKSIPSRNIYREGDIGGVDILERADLTAAELSDCPICSQSFSVREIQDHASQCLPDENNLRMPPGGSESADKVCPMCSETFSSVVPQSDFEAHVNRHFGDEILENFEVLNP